jgi:hypothetical protein
MGLDIFDALSAAGAGLGVIGQEKAKVRDEDRKAKFAEKLERQRLEMQDQYEQNKEKRAEARERLKPTGTPEVHPSADGSMHLIQRNSYGDPVIDRPMDKYEIESFNRDQQKDKLSLDSVVADIGYKHALTNESNARATDAPLDRQLKRENIQSMIDARADAADARKHAHDDKGLPTDRSLPGLTSYLIDQFKDLGKQYTDGPGATMTPDEFRQVAQESVRIAAQNKQDARIIFQDALRRYGKPRYGKKPGDKPPTY